MAALALDIGVKFLGELSWVEPAEDPADPHDRVEDRHVTMTVGHTGDDDIILADTGLVTKDMADPIRQCDQVAIACRRPIGIDHGDLVGIFPAGALQPPTEIHLCPPLQLARAHVALACAISRSGPSFSDQMRTS